jgi:hypothetical protein
MAFATNVCYIEFETANDWTFSSGLATHNVNVLTAPLEIELEELLKYASGRRENTYTPVIPLKLYPFLVSPNAAYPNTDDKIALLLFLKTNKALRVKKCTLERYDTSGIASAKALLESLHFTVTSISSALSEEKGEEDMTLTLTSINPL